MRSKFVIFDADFHVVLNILLIGEQQDVSFIFLLAAFISTPSITLRRSSPGGINALVYRYTICHSRRFRIVPVF